MHDHRSILVSWYTDPRYIPPFRLAEGQVTVGPGEAGAPLQAPFYGYTPRGAYDLEEALASQGLDADYDLIVVWSDASGTNFPHNLDAFACPKVLCVGDTHHLAMPLQKMVAYATRAGYDFVISSHNRHHLHWFVEAGIGNVAWLPGLKARHLPRPITAAREAHIAFLGQTGTHHARRRHLLQQLGKVGLPVQAETGTRERAADMYASSAVSFNASLNGDLNLRVFEILSAGGCLLTDRLSPESGIDLILQEGADMMCYDTAEELVDKARHLLARPERALAIARRGRDTYARALLPRLQGDRLLGWVFDARLDTLYRPNLDRYERIQPSEPGDKTTGRADLATRLRCYEHLQALQQQRERSCVLFGADVHPACVADALDLHRLQPVALASPANEARNRALQAMAGASLITEEQARRKVWDRVVAHDSRELPAQLRSEAILELRRK